MRTLFVVVAGLAVVVVVLFANAEHGSTRQLLAGCFALLLGTAAIVSGLRAVATGRVLLRSRHAERESQPGAFWTSVIVLRFGVGAVLAAAGAWLLIGRAG